MSGDRLAISEQNLEGTNMLFRTNGPWGSGKGSNLTAPEVDGNFYELDQRVADVEADPPTPISVDHVEVTSSTFSIVLTDASVQGPFPLPFSKFNLLGEWQPLTTYASPNSFVTEGGNTYLVQFPHTSAATFDPGANDGAGHNYYGLLPFPNAPIIEFLPGGWVPSTAMGAYKLFSVPDVGVFLSLRAHTTASTFDPLAEDGLGNPLYQMVFGAIETNRARIQVQFPGTPPSNGSTIMVYIQDDPRLLAFPSGWLDSSAHLEVAVTAELEWTIKSGGITIGTVTFSPGELLDGEGGQYATISGTGTGDAPIENLGLVKIVSPLIADATARFFTLSMVGTYEDAAS